MYIHIHTSLKVYTKQEMEKLETQFLHGKYNPLEPNSAALSDYPPQPIMDSQAVNNTVDSKQKKTCLNNQICFVYKLYL